MWFAPRNVVQRVLVVLMLFFCAGTYMFVWCELFTPRWYDGRFRSRFGLLVSNTEKQLLEGGLKRAMRAP